MSDSASCESARSVITRRILSSALSASSVNLRKGRSRILRFMRSEIRFARKRLVGVGLKHLGEPVDQGDAVIVAELPNDKYSISGEAAGPANLNLSRFGRDQRRQTRFCQASPATST